MKHSFKRTVMAAATATALLFTGCTTIPEAGQKMLDQDAQITKSTRTQRALQALPPPSSKVTVAVYNFEDKTGQFKPTDAGQTLSRAVSQGGDELLIDALQDAGLRSWFTVIERSNLNNLLKERQIITEMRSRYLGETTINSQALPPLLFAGVILEGGIVGYDVNTVTGGAAARYLGVGGRTDYRQNVVTVHLRAVSVKTGEVLASVTTEKTVASYGVSANAFRFVSFDELLEADVGITANEPGLMALRQAVEKSVYSLVMEGAEIGLWSFADQTQGMALVDEYTDERGGYSLTNAVKSARKPATNQMAAVKPAARKLPPAPVKKPAPKPAPVKMTAAKPVAPKITAAPTARVQTQSLVAAKPVKASPVTPTPVARPAAATPPAYSQPTADMTARSRALSSLSLIEGTTFRTMP